jgi:signal transduction histidine kinase
VNHRGPYAQVGLVAQPILVLVLCGFAAARVAILASTAILASAPFLRVQPGVARVLALDPAQVVEPVRLVWFQAAVLTAFLAILLILLERFHHFLLGALAAQCREMRERRHLEREIAGISDGERRRLGQELHDGVCQQVTAALLRCQALERRLERGGTLAGADFQRLSSLLAETIDDAHNVALGLCPLEPDPETLAPALRALIKRTGELAAVRCEFLAAGDVHVPEPAMAQHLYRIAQEALSNAVRHAHASRIAVELRGGAGELTLQVEDDGVGLPVELSTSGMGLRTMRYRAQILEGELTVAPAAGGGTRVTCRVPRPDAGPDARHDSGGQRWIPAA